MATPNGQGAQAHANGDTPAIQGQANGYHHDAQAHGPTVTPQGYTQPHMAGVNGKEVNGLTHAIGAMTFPTGRGSSKYVPKGIITPHTNPIDYNAMQRNPAAQQYMVVPNGAMVGSNMPPVPAHLAQALSGGYRANQGSPLPCVPTDAYSGAPFVPGYHWPYSFSNNNDGPDSANPLRDSWTPVDENNPGNFSGMAGQGEHYYPGVSPAAMAGYVYNGTPCPMPYQPYQMMRTPSGYAWQDLDALLKQDPPIPAPVPAMWTNPSDVTLARSLENREGITNVYIRGFLPETTDAMLESYASRFGKIERCKAIVDLDTGLCKGFGFVQFYSYSSCENCIRGFFHLGYQASYAQKSRNSRLKDLEDKTSANIYCTNLPIEWAEADLRHHFEPYQVVSEKISRDERTGISKEVGFARFENREIAETVLAEFHNVTAADGVKLLLRFADTKAQKQLKHQSNERRAYRAGEYNFSVGIVKATPSPESIHGFGNQATPNSRGSNPSPLGFGQVWTPATSISPPGPMMNKPMNGWRYNSYANRWIPTADNTPSGRARLGPNGVHAGRLSGNRAARRNGASSTTPPKVVDCKTPSPQKAPVRAGTTSPIPSRKEANIATPKSSV